MELPHHHARALLQIAQDDGTRLRDLADALGVTERTVGEVLDLLLEARRRGGARR